MLTCLRLFLYSPTERMTLRSVSSWNWPSSTALTATPPNPPPPRQGVSPLPPLVSPAAADAHSQPTPVLCAVFIALCFFSLLSSPLAVCVYFFALWCFFFGLRNFFFLPPPLEMATPDGLGHRSL